MAKKIKKRLVTLILGILAVLIAVPIVASAAPTYWNYPGWDGRAFVDFIWGKTHKGLLQVYRNLNSIIELGSDVHRALLTALYHAGVDDGSITSAKITDATIGTVDIADGAITSAKILDGTIATADIADGAVDSAKILDGTIVDDDVADAAAIRLSKLVLGTDGQIIVADATGVPTYVAMSGDATIDNTGALTLTTAYLPLAGGTMSGVLNMGSQNITGVGTVTFSNGETLDNATDGTVTVGGKLLVNGVRISDIVGYEQFLKVTGNLTGVGSTDNAKTWVVQISATRPAGYDVAYADFDDAGLKLTMTNEATGNIAGYIMRGLDVAVKNRDGGSITTLSGGHISATQYASSPVTDTLSGLTIKVEADSPNTAPTYVYGLNVEYDMVAPTGTPTLSAGVRVNQNSDYYVSYPLAGFMVDNGAANMVWQYGLYIDDGTIGTSDIRLQNGETISNATDGTIDFGSAIANAGSFLVDSQTTQAFKAEYNIDVQQGAWVHGVKVELTRTANIQPATGGWYGGQFVLNAGSDAGYAILNKPAYALQAIFKGSRTAASSAEANVARFETQSDGKVDDMVYILNNTGGVVEGSGIYIANHATMPQAIQINGAAGTLTDAIDMLGTIAGYGIDMSAATIGTADIRLSSGAMIISAAGAPAGACTTGSLYLRTDGGANTTLYVCEAGAWAAK